jgi:toxin ParE2
MIVRYHELAMREVVETTEHYAQLRDGLGEEFRQELDLVVSMIAKAPYQFEQIRPGMRRCLLRRFPYGVYYRLPDANVVQVVVVKHHSRKPGYGLRRS